VSSPDIGVNALSTDSHRFSPQAFVQLIEKEKRPLLTNNAELDGLMIKALQVLRIHLLELEKVQELCRDFCTRYIACLRGKMQSENLLRSDYAMEHISNSNMSNSNSPVNSPADQVSRKKLVKP
jgi:N-terminal of Homeobox Meis and PKNOX1